MSTEVTTHIRHANKTILAFVIFNLIAQLLLIPVIDYLPRTVDFAIPLVTLLFVVGYFQYTRKSVNETLPFTSLPFKSWALISVMAGVTLFMVTPFFGWLGQLVNPVELSTQEFFLDFLKQSGVVSFVLLGSLAAPFVEEVVFRGVLMDGYKKTNTVVAVIVTSLFFTLSHVALDQMVYVFIVGVVLALTALITQSLLASLWVHILFNSLSTAVTLILFYVSPDELDKLTSAEASAQIADLPYLITWCVLGMVILYFIFRKLMQIHNFTFKWDKHRFVDGYLILAMLVSIGMVVAYLLLA